MLSINPLPAGKKLYFVSDFHLGVPDLEESRKRERKIVKWLDSISADAGAIFMLGDIFDFWFEYKHTVPKGFLRFIGKIAELRDREIPIYFFTGNHDMWMFNYFTNELGIPIIRRAIELKTENHNFLIGHGDGLGPGDYGYKFIKSIFTNKLCQWLFSLVPPAIGLGIAKAWSKKSRINNNKDDIFLGEQEHLWIYCQETEAKKHHDFYVFGHRHLPLDLKVGTMARYINLGEWINHCRYAIYDGTTLVVHEFLQKE